MAKCKMCGKSVTMAFIRYKWTDEQGRKHDICKKCIKSANGRTLKYSESADLLYYEGASTKQEIVVKCRTCGHVFCYNEEDIKNNRKQAWRGIMSGVASISETVGGTRIAGAIHSQNADNALNKVVDYDKCPNCNSRDIEKTVRTIVIN